MLVGGGEVVVDVAGRPGLLPLERLVAGAELAVAHAGFLGAGVDQAERLVRGAEHRRLLDHPGRRGGAERVGLVALVVGELAVGARPPGALLPLLASHRVVGAVRDRAERVERPLRRVGGQLGAELVAAGVGGVGAVLQELRGPWRR